MCTYRPACQPLQKGTLTNKPFLECRPLQKGVIANQTCPLCQPLQNRALTDEPFQNRRVLADESFPACQPLQKCGASNKSLSTLIGLSRHTLLIEVTAKLDPKYNNGMGDLLNFKKVQNTSPSKKKLNPWVDNLAVDQVIIAGHQILQAESLCSQNNGAPDGSYTKFFSWFDCHGKAKTPDGTVHKYFAGVETLCLKLFNVRLGEPRLNRGVLVRVMDIIVKSVHSNDTSSCQTIPLIG